MPLLVFCYFVAILDRANVGVAALFRLAAMALLSIVVVTIVLQLWERPERAVPVPEY
jgi:hypothetical protein